MLINFFQYEPKEDSLETVDFEFFLIIYKRLHQINLKFIRKFKIIIIFLSLFNIKKVKGIKNLILFSNQQ